MLKLVIGSLVALSGSAFAAELKAGDAAPIFTAKTHEGKDFDLKSRKGQWTVLYFYPKADTPGCTKQACAFRDNIEQIRTQGAEVYGVSTDTVADQAAFHKKHGLNFPLIADADGAVVKAYGTKMPVMSMSKRWTFLIDPDLKIKWIEKDVDPVKDAETIAAKITELKPKAVPGQGTKTH